MDLSEQERRAIGRRSWRRAIVLFLLTLLSTFTVGAGMVLTDPNQPFVLLDGWVFAVPLMGILLFHELGHYFLARRHNIETSPPYFIPFPNLIGTVGAFISIRSPIYNRKQLLDIGAAGPLAGFVPSVIMLAIGYRFSEVAVVPAGVEFLSFGDSILTRAIQSIMLGPIPEGYSVWIHPVGLAGWVGLFVTMLNLLPIWMLDGGHIAYALLGRKQWSLGPAVFAAIVLLGLLVEPWWLYILGLWALLIVIYAVVARLFMGARIPLGALFSGRALRHPPVMNEEPLDGVRRLVGWLALAILLLSFIPAPIRFIST